MGILRDFERRLEGAVEGFFARAFRSGLQPVELAKAVQRYASSYKQVGVDGIVVPNVYRIALARSDAERFTGYGEALRHELAGVVHRSARERGWRLKGPVRIETTIDDSLKIGTYEIRGKIEVRSAPQESRPSAPAPAQRPRRDDGDYQGWQAPMSERTQALDPVPLDEARVEILDGAQRSEPRPVRRGSTLGRLPACDVTLEDPSVSRRHARVDRSPDGWVIEDLGSTNGVKVNGRSVDRAPLEDGDEIELGTVRLTFSVGSGDRR